MAMRREDLRVPSGERQPQRERQREGADWHEARRRFTHERLAKALGGFLPRQPVKP